jgi:hypothetical protein
LRSTFTHHLRQLIGAQAKAHKYRRDSNRKNLYYNSNQMHLDLLKLSENFDYFESLETSFAKRLVYVNINLFYESLFFYPKTQNFLNNFKLLFNNVSLPCI